MSLLSAGPFTAYAKDRLLYEEVFIEISENECVLLSGPSGSGKTTLLRQIVGLHPAPGAQRTLRGRSYSLRELPLFRRDCLFLSSEAPCLPGTIEENLRFPFELKLARDDFDPEKARTLLKAVGLAHLSPGQEVQSLSLGERHRLAMVRAILWNPCVILADEPFTGLDEKTFQASWNLLKGEFLQRPGKALLIVSHDGLSADEVRHLYLRQGKLIAK